MNDLNPKDRIQISSTKSLYGFAEELAGTAAQADFLESYWSAKKKNEVSGPGKMIEALSEQEREVIKQLKPEHFR
jgi:hypothetical protein